MMATVLLATTLSPVGLFLHAAAAGDYAIQPAPFTSVRIDDAFWKPRQETNRRVTLPYCFQKCEETGRIANFAKAAGLMDGEFEGIFYNDSDVFKVVEGAAYALSIESDPELDRYLDELIAMFAGAQEPDGYLYTCRRLRPNDMPRGAGAERWSALRHSHELYNVGHMYEAAAAHHLATGRRTLLDIALKSADLVDAVFGPEEKRDVPGHQEIELALVKLYRLTGERRYLDLAKFFLDERGHAHGRELYGPYLQDHQPVIEQREAVGHAVRAGYMYAGMTDVAALTGDAAYIEALDALWEDVAGGKLYLTGGVGARREGEAFGDAYELPNRTAYNETCAAIASILWNHRMFLLHGDARYMDVVERTLYNGFLVGVSLSGDRFFYPNPLECDGAYPFNHGSLEREPWFGTSCCPVNVVRFVASLAGYVYGIAPDSVYVNLFVAGEGELAVGDRIVKIAQATRYPWDGTVEMTVSPDAPAEFALRVRVPGWAVGTPVPSDLYRYIDGAAGPMRLTINGEETPAEMDKGYAVIKRTWRDGDRVRVEIPMPIRRVVSHDNVQDNRGRVALERGPLVYCVEAADHGGRALNLTLPDTSELTTEHRDGLLGGVTVLCGPGQAKHAADDGAGYRMEDVRITAIPYYAWAHRGPGEMTVWIARDPERAQAAPRATVATMSRVSASHTGPSDTVRAINDTIEPASSGEHAVPRFTWWDRRGTREWVQYDFREPASISRVAVYWFDDTGRGQCRAPKSWRLLYREDGEWKTVRGASEYGVALDRYNEATFEPVRTDGLRIEAELQEGFSGGILEWRVE